VLVELEQFKNEKNVYAEKLQEINASAKDDNEKLRNIHEATEAYKGQIRKLLPSALNVIKTLFQIEYSLYKVGKDFTSEFQVVETNVRKVQSEVITEMQELVNQTANMNLSPEQINQLNLSIELIITYVDEGEVDSVKEERLENISVAKTSIIEPPKTEMAPVISQPVTPEPTFNPYANNPIDVEEGFKSPSYNKETYDNPFAALYGDIQPQENTEQPLEQQPVASNRFLLNNDEEVKQPEQIQPQPGPPDLLAPQPGIFHAQPQQQVVQQPVQQQYPQQVVHQPMQQQYPQQVVQMPMPPPEQPQVMEQSPQLQPLLPEERNWVGSSYEVKSEKTFVPKLLVGLIGLPVMTILITAIIAGGIFILGEYTNLLNWLTQTIGNEMYLIGILKVVIIFLSSVLSGLLIKYITKKTDYMGKFVILPIVILIALVLASSYLLQILFDDFVLTIDFKTSLISAYYLLWILVSMWSIIILLVRSFFTFCDRKESKSQKIRWNFLEKISILKISYVAIIPSIYIVLEILSINPFENIFNMIYGYNNIFLILLISSGVLALFMIPFNIKEDLEK